MLASIGNYLDVWEAYELFPTILVCLAVWLLGGGYLFQKILGPQTDRRKYPLKQGVLVSLLSGMGGGFAAVLLFFICIVIFPPEEGSYSTYWFGAVMGTIGYVVTAYLIVFSMHKLDAGETFKASIVPIVVPFLVGGILMGSSFYFFSFTRFQANLQKGKLIENTFEKMGEIHNSLEKKRLETGRLTSSLEDLVKEGYLQPEDLTSPANSKGRGFFFNGGRTKSDLNSRVILLCDYAENFGELGRTVLYDGGYVQFLAPASFRAMLNQPENQGFAKDLEAAEKK